MQAFRFLMPLCFAVAGTAFAGCDTLWGRQLRPEFCRDHPDDPDCIREFGDAGPKCTSNAECMSPNAVCDLASTKTCVQCIAPDQVAACSGTAPTCGGDHACHACSKHDDCTASSACLPDGSCAAQTDVAYVDPVSGSGTACSLASPCKKVMDALTTRRKYVKLAGMIDEEDVMINNQSVTILAGPNTTLTRSMPGVILKVDGSSVVHILDLTISNGLGGGGVGIALPAGNTATLELERVTISSNAGGGILANAGTLTLAKSTISGNQIGGISTSGALTVSQSSIITNQGFGITTSGGLLQVSRSGISQNASGGIQMTADGMLLLENNVLDHNGNDISGGFGGLSIRPVAGSRVQFNTIIDNKANFGAASAGGVFCDVAGFIAGNNIIFRNTGGPTTTTQTFGNCTYGSSFVAAASAADNSPQFQHPNTTPFDYHLTASSPVTIRDAGGPCSTTDYDGYQRPYGSACDLGAFEYHP